MTAKCCEVGERNNRRTIPFTRAGLHQGPCLPQASKYSVVIYDRKHSTHCLTSKYSLGLTSNLICHQLPVPIGQPQVFSSATITEEQTELRRMPS